MDTKSSKVFALLFVLLLVTGPTCASATCCGCCLQGTGIVAVIYAVGYAVYQAYHVVKAVWWTWKFADYLLDEPSVTDVSDWLLKNTPTFTFFTAMKFFLSDKETKAMKDYSNRLSTPNQTCNQTLAEFMKTF